MLFRAEFFNITNRANFNLPNPIIFSGNSISLSAGKITSTKTSSSRQTQFGLKTHVLIANAQSEPPNGRKTLKSQLQRELHLPALVDGVSDLSESR